MTNPLSVCCFIRNANEGAFCLWESMAMLLPLADEFLVLDLGSTDGTWQLLQDIAASNRKVRLEQGSFPSQDAGAFATLANDLIAACRHNLVYYYQADEVPHEHLTGLFREQLAAGARDLAFWRIQYRRNFQEVKWFPHPVHRLGHKGDGLFNFIGDGMNTDRVFGLPVCSAYDMGYFSRWQTDFGPEGIKPYVSDMLMDVSSTGGFLDNIAAKRYLHAPFWHEGPEPLVDGRPVTMWLEQARLDPAWKMTSTPYNLPAVMRYHVGHTLYHLRPDLFWALKQDKTADYVWDLVKAGEA